MVLHAIIVYLKIPSVLGYLNFDFARNRVIFSSRKNAPIRAIPKTDTEIHSYRGKTRGEYTKK